MAQFDGRWLRRVLAVGLVATLPVVASSTPVAAAGNGCGDGLGTWDIVWTGAAGDEAWDNSANWEAEGGSARTPIATDSVCIDTSVGGAVESGGLEVDSVSVVSRPTDPPVRLHGSIAAHWGINGRGPIVFVDDTTINSTLDGIRLSYARIDAGASVEVAGTLDADRVLDVAGQLTVHSSASFHAVTIRPGGNLAVEAIEPRGWCPYLTSGQRCAVFTGPIDVQPGGSASVTGEEANLAVLDPIVVFTAEASLVAGTVALRDISVDHDGPFPVALTIGTSHPVYLNGVGPDSTLTVERAAGSPVPFTLKVFVDLYGTLSVAGQPGPNGPVDVIDGAMWIHETGSVAFDGVDGRFGSLSNQGTLRLDRAVVQSDDGGPFVLFNTGRLEIGARQGPESDPLRASAVFADLFPELLNLGEVVAVDPAAELTLGGYMQYEPEIATPIRGTMDVPVSLVVPVLHAPFLPDPEHPLTVPWLAWGAGAIGAEVTGVTEGAASRVEVEGLLRDAGDRQLIVLPGDGYEPCAGERWPVVTFDRSALGYRLPTDGVSSVPGAQPSAINALTGAGPDAGWSVVASDRPGSVVATVTGTSSEGCSTPAGGRFVSALYVEGTGRVPTDAEYALRAGRSETIAGRLAQARVVMKGAAARDHQIDEQYRRILDRPVAPASQSVWRTRLAGPFWTVDKLRGALYGSQEFWDQNGALLSSVTDAVYQRELGRAATAAEQSAITQQVAAGTSRASVFTALMGTAEVDITTGAAMVERWWARDATLFEAFYVGALLHRGDAEHLVAADLAAGLPLS